MLSYEDCLSFNHLVCGRAGECLCTGHSTCQAQRAHSSIDGRYVTGVSGMTRGGATCFSDREAVARTVPPGAAMLPWGDEATTKEVFC